jgi:RimJ/RimL family protein N-acetyltransferase
MKTSLITTKRLSMRPLLAEDATFIISQYNEPAFLEHIGDKNIRTVDDAIEEVITKAEQSYYQDGVGLFLVTLQACGTAIGTCGLLKRDNVKDFDLGYAILEQYHRNGYVMEAALAVLEYAKNELGLKRILGYTAPTNKVSIGILETLGFEAEGEFVLPGYDSESIVFALRL